MFVATLDTFGPTYYRNAAAPPSADYSIEADFVYLTAVNNQQGIALRMDAAGNGYRLSYSAAAAQWQIDRMDAFVPIGPLATLADGFNGLTGTRHASLAISGANLSATVDTVGTLAAVDATHAGPGLAGLIARTVNTSTTGLHIDNLQAQ